jgi:phosphoadenosine phosphosulfate reductase
MSGAVRAIDADQLRAWNAALEPLSAAERIAFALRHFPEQHVLSSSFGAQSAAILHMAKVLSPELPIIVIDTGYLFAETYGFIEQLSAQLALNVQRFSPKSQWPEQRLANLQQEGLDGITQYNQIHKIEPMQRALSTLRAGTWISGLRRDQARTRAHIPLLEMVDGRLKLYPIADWRDQQIGRYMAQHKLPYHPLWEQGYVSIGDRYLTAPIAADGDASATRFFGLKRECGLHEFAEK